MNKATSETKPKTWAFPSGALAFLKELRANNNREWFQNNRQVYDDSVKQPADAFCALITEGLDRSFAFIAT